MTQRVSFFYKHSNLKNIMNTMLVNNSTALKLRSFFALLFMVGMINVASANTYYSYNATTGSVVTLPATNTGTKVTSGTLYTFSGGIYTAGMIGR